MRFTVLFLLASLAPALASQRPITIDDVIAPRESASIYPIWAESGKTFAYEKDGKVFRYQVGWSKPRVWFDLDSLATEANSQPEPYKWRNRRVDDNALQWFPNGKDLLVFKDGKLYLVHPDGHPQPVKLGSDIEAPLLSPDGSAVLYRDHQNLFVHNFAAHHTVQLTSDGSPTLLNGELDWVYPEELDLGQAAWWSPDSKHIAYLQFDVSREFVYPHADLLGERAVSEPERYPQAGTPNASVRLGIVAATGGTTVWAQIGGSPDVLMARVAWLPDSSRVAIETAPRIQDSLDLWLCDPSSGAVQNILHEHSETWINITDNLIFLKSRPEFLWTSERSGFRHIYRYSDKGELLGQLTSGNWEIRGILSIDEAAGRVFYASAEDTPLETHLYSVPVEGGNRSRLTMPGFDHQISADPSGHYFTDENSNLSNPPQTNLIDAHGSQIASLHAREKAPAYDLPASAIVGMKASDGTLLYGRLLKPADYVAGKPYPLIVSVYGGPGAQRVRNDWQLPGMDQIYAANGFLVWTLDNRGSSGRGHAFETPLHREMGHVEVADQRMAVEQLIHQGIADPHHIGVTGWSYGGYMTIRCLLTAPDLFSVGVAGAPVTDWHNYDTIYTERYLGLPDSNASGYAASSNVVDAANLQGKLLILHNFEDDNVLFQNTMQMANALEEADKQFYLQVYPFKTHGVTGPLRKPSYQAMLDFFNRNLH